MSEYEKQLDKTPGELSIFQAWRMKNSQIIFEGEGGSYILTFQCENSRGGGS